eukprot:166142-Heterocapsa_arctica.AAC.1
MLEPSATDGDSSGLPNLPSSFMVPVVPLYSFYTFNQFLIAHFKSSYGAAFPTVWPLEGPNQGECCPISCGDFWGFLSLSSHGLETTVFARVAAARNAG